MEIKLVSYFDQHYYKINFDDDTEDDFVSVTTKLNAMAKPFLARWRGDIGNREADLRMYDASNRGQRIHYACTLYVNGGVIILNPFARPYFSPEEIQKLRDKSKTEVFILQDQDEMIHVNRFQQWMNRTGAKCVCSDTIVYDLENKEAGTLDFIFEIPGGTYEVNGKTPVKLESGIYVADLKSGNDIHDEAYLQISAYAVMYLNMHKEFVDSYRGGLIIHTNSSIRTGIIGLSTHVRGREKTKQDYQDFRSVANIWDRTNKNAKPKNFEIPAMITRNEEILKGE